MSAPDATISIGEQDLLTTVRYAGASGDLNPLHYDPAAASRAGFARVLVHGGWLAARVERALETEMEPRALSVRFERPVMIGEPLALRWTRDAGRITAAMIVDDETRASAVLSDEVVPSAETTDLEVLDEPFDWPVEHGALRDFLAATGGAQRDLSGIPLAFLSNAARFTRAPVSIVRRLGFAYDRLLHGSSEFRMLGDPIRPGEMLKVTEAHANRETRPHRSGGTMRIADTLHQIADPDGRPRALVINRFIERPARPSS